MKNHKDWEISRILRKVRAQVPKKWSEETIFQSALFQCEGSHDEAEKMLRDIDIDPVQFSAYVEKFRRPKFKPIKHHIGLFEGLFVGSLVGAVAVVFFAGYLRH